MPRKGGLSNILRQLTSPNPRKRSMNRFNRQPRNMIRETPIVEPQQASHEEREPFYGLFGPEPGFIPGLSNSEQGFQEYGIFNIFGPEPITDVSNEINTGTENPSFENEDRNNGYSIF